MSYFIPYKPVVYTYLHFYVFIFNTKGIKNTEY